MMNTLRFMTWNVHGPLHLNPTFDLDAVCAVIEKWSPDVVALQEVDSRGQRTDPFKRLAEAVGEHRAEARSIVTRDGAYGQMLVSRWPFVELPKIVDVSYQEREQRRAIVAKIGAPFGEVKVVATHLGLSLHERHAQARAVADLIDSPRTVVMGDFNDWLWVKSVRRVLARHCPVRTGHRTFPSVCPILRLDRIYATPDCGIVRSWTDSKARGYSDHLPLLSEVKFCPVSISDRGVGRDVGEHPSPKELVFDRTEDS
ncbi:endonuclease/exonuclease/phosphatase family metal-dependent hydrolase [Nitrobacteraceae bacterium AZCC 1564]